MSALEGLLVVSVEQAVAAPLCTARLVAAGARVIKIEREEGDFARGYDTAAKGESSYFTWLNQGKESLVLNFKDDDGSALLWRLLKKADVLVQNLAPGALARSGFSTEKLHQVNPKLIVCNISGYGSSGKASTLPAYDLLVQAESGLIATSGSEDAPGRIGVSICDIGAGMTAYSGVLEALLKRGISGKGEEFGVSLFDVAAEWMSVPYIHAEYGNGAPRPIGLRHPSIAPYGAYACSDNRLVLISIQNEREWQRLCADVLEQHGLISDTRFATNNLRVDNFQQLDEALSAITVQLSSAEFIRRLTSARIAFGSINSPNDLKAHPAIRHAQFQTAKKAFLQLPANAVHWSTPSEQNKPKKSTPKCGEHTAAIKAEFDHR